MFLLSPAPPLSLPVSPSPCQEALAAAETRLTQDKFELELRSIEREMGLQHTIGELQEALAAKVRREQWSVGVGRGTLSLSICAQR